MRKTTVLDRQTIVDIAVREHGSVEGLFSVLKDNPQVEGVSDQLLPGQQLDVKAAPVDAVVTGFYQANNLYPVTDTLLPVDECSGYPCIPRNVQAYAVTTPDFQSSLEVIGTPVGRRFFITDLTPAEDPETASLFARYTGYVLRWRGLGDTGGAEGTAWDVISVAPGSVIDINTGTSYWKSWNAASGTAVYPSGRFGLPWLPPPTEEGSFEKVSRSMEEPIQSAMFSPCRWWQVQRQSLMEGGDFVDFGERRKENDPTLFPLEGGFYLYRILWSTGAGTICVQGYSETILLV
jgi:hypothetical protein